MIPETTWRGADQSEYGVGSDVDIVDPSGLRIVDTSAVDVIDTGVIDTPLPATLWGQQLDSIEDESDDDILDESGFSIYSENVVGKPDTPWRGADQSEYGVTTDRMLVDTLGKLIVDTLQVDIVDTGVTNSPLPNTSWLEDGGL